MPDRSQRTEEPTPRRLEKARREGQFPVSREFVSGVQFVAFVWLLGTCGADWFAHMRALTRTVLREAVHTDISPAVISNHLLAISRTVLVPLLIGGALLVAASVGSQLAVTRLGVSLAKVRPDLKRLNPLRKMAELPRQNLVQFLQSAILLPAFGLAAWMVAEKNAPLFWRLPFQAVEAGLAGIAAILQNLLWKAAACLFLWGVFDLVRQRRRHNSEMRMTRQEVRDEARESEGHPQVKGRIRRLQRDLLRRRMMSEVPAATAVIVNPTHYAVAIRYRMEAMGAPVVVAKGKNYLALRIRQKALEHLVPIVENAPLAQALYASVDVGREIPPVLYRAVAEILAYIHRLREGRR